MGSQQSGVAATDRALISPVGDTEPRVPPALRAFCPGNVAGLVRPSAGAPASPTTRVRPSPQSAPSGSRRRRRRPTQGRLLRPRRGGRRLASRRPSASHGSARRRRVAFAPVLPSRAWGRVAASCDGADKRGKRKRNGFGRRERPIGMLTESTVRFVVRWWADVCFVPRGIFGALPWSGVWSTTKACGRSRHARLAWGGFGVRHAES